MSTRVVNLRTAPQRDSSFMVYIGRAGNGQDGTFGNPYVLVDNSDAGRKLVLEKFEIYFLKRVVEDAEFRAKVLALKGKVLACFCKPLDCHGDIMARWIDAQ